MQEPFLSCNAIFFITINGIEHTAQIDFENIETGKTQNLYASLDLYIYDSLSYVAAKIDQKIAQEFNELVDPEADVALYRLTARNIFTGQTFKFQREYPLFSIAREIILFECDTEACRNYLRQIRGEIGEYQFQFDVTRLVKGEFSAIASQYLNASDACISSGFVGIAGKNRFCLNFVTDAFCALKRGQSVDLQASLVDASEGTHVADYVFSE